MVRVPLRPLLAPRWTPVTLMEHTAYFFVLKFDSCWAGYDFAHITDIWGSHINERQGRTIPGMKSDNSLWIKPTDALNSRFIGITILHVSVDHSDHHQELLALHRQCYILCSFDDLSLQEQDGTAVLFTKNLSWCTVVWSYCKMETEKQSSTSPAAARRWLDSATTSLASRLLNQKI